MVAVADYLLAIGELNLVAVYVVYLAGERHMAFVALLVVQDVSYFNITHCSPTRWGWNGCRKLDPLAVLPRQRKDSLPAQPPAFLVHGVVDLAYGFLLPVAELNGLAHQHAVGVGLADATAHRAVLAQRVL